MSSRMDEAAVEPRTVAEARTAVEQSRQRISSTLDALEDRIVEKKHEFQERVNVLGPVKDRVRERPFTAIAVAVGVGALLGSLGGGAADDADYVARPRGRTRSRGLDDDARRELREWRKQRRERLRSRVGTWEDDGGSSRMDGIKHQLMGAVTAAITTAISTRVRELARNATGGGSRDRAELRGGGRYDR